MTHAEAMAHQARVLHQRGLSVEGGGVDKESELHREILSECKRRGWYIAHHSRMDEPSTCPVGSPDFVIFAHKGRVISVECKAKSGKLSQDQLGTVAWAQKLGHEIHIVRSISDFNNICEEVLK
jgi:hypothetical protein